MSNLSSMTSSANDNTTSKGIVKYTSRDYESLQADFWDMVPKLTELWKPEADADPGVVLGKYLSSVADVLGINLDILANEVYAPSVSQRKNAEKLFALIGYELGWYTAARTEISFTNGSAFPIYLDFGFNGANFCTVNAYSDITGQARVLTYNILPLTNGYGDNETRSRRSVKTENLNIFADADKVTLEPGETVTRVGIEGELRSYSVSVDHVKKNNYIINIPSQHIDTTAVWIKAKNSKNATEFLETQWIQCESPSEFIVPEPRFAVTYDSYSNAQIQVSNYLNQLENYENNYLTVYWIDCSGIIGCVGTDVLSNFLPAKPNNGDDYNVATDASGEIRITNLSNTIELPHTYTVTGRSPETAKEAYQNSRNYINTWDSLITLPDFNRFLNREPGVDCGLVIDCQKALEINKAIYEDPNLSAEQKSKMYINNLDFPAGDPNADWTELVKLSYDPSGEDGTDLKYISNFKTYTAMCYAVHNDFGNSAWGQGQVSNAQTVDNKHLFIRYKPPVQFIDNVIRDYRPLQAMSVELQFGYLRVFPFHVSGTIYPTKPVSKDVAANIIEKVKEDLALYFSPANRQIGQKPTIMEIVKVIQNADSRIDYFDAGNARNEVIIWSSEYDIDYFNPISFAKYADPGLTANNIIIAPEYIVG